MTSEIKSSNGLKDFWVLIKSPPNKDENTSKEWKLRNIEELRSRLDGWQLEAFNESYKSKQETGLSLIKKKLLESRNN